MTWPSAGGAPNYNIIGIDPQLRDPEHGDFRPAPDSPALGYGCQTFSSQPRRADGQGVSRGPMNGSGDPPGCEIGRTGPRLFEVSGTVTADAVWDADTVRVVGDVTVAGGVTLGIAPGVSVVFGGYYALNVAGRLLAIGTPEARISFDSEEPGSWVPDSSSAGSWGGIRFDGTPAALGPSRLEWCELRHAKGVGDRRKGGALSLIDCSGLRVRNCLFRENAAEYGAVLFCEHMANPVVSGSLLAGNVALTAGSAVYCIDSYPRLFENTIADNACLNPEYMYDTGAIHNHLSKTWVAGNIVYGNTSSYFLPIQMREAKAFCVRFSDVQYGIDGEGDFDADPLFEGSGPHPYQLSAGSPCRNTGPLDTDAFGLLPVDLAAVTRSMGGRIDVGAYESGDASGVGEPETNPYTPAGGDRASTALELSCTPNPTAGVVTIRLRLGRPAKVRLSVHDVLGRRVALVLDTELAAGERVVRWDGRDSDGDRLLPGVYFLRGRAGGGSTTSVHLVVQH